uniref:Uncharacterized protein n=1 Tax=Panagrolaimus davidi TaxID=227884 RepID=A0A914QZ03_9BILA
MKVLLLFCCILIGNFGIVTSAKILALHVHDERSHLYSMAPFLKTLSESGHEVTVFDSASDSKPAKLGFNATVVHSYLPAYEPHQKFVSTFFWEHDPHAAVTGLVHKTADEEMGRLILQRADKVKLFLAGKFVLNERVLVC